MKSKCSFILKASTALVLALLMLFGTVASSVAAVVDDYADTGAQADVADEGAAVDVADEGAEADLAETGDDKTFTTNSYFYVKNQPVADWNANLWVGSSSAEIKMLAGDVTYSLSLYDGTAGNATAVYRAKITGANNPSYYGAYFHRWSGNDDWGTTHSNWFKTTAGNYMSAATTTSLAGNSDKDYTLGYYAPKVNTATITIPGAVSGTGTSSDPYILDIGETYTPSLYMETDDCGATGFLWSTSSSYSSSASTYHAATASSANSKAYWTTNLTSITPSAANSSNTAVTYYTWCYQSARGTAHSTASKSATVYYQVRALTPKIDSITPGSTSLKLGEETTVTTVLANTSSPTVTYSSSNDSVLSVTKVSNTSATVKALAPGSATITASLTDGSYTDSATTSSISVATPTVNTWSYANSGNCLVGRTLEVGTAPTVTNTNADADVVYHYYLSSSGTTTTNTYISSINTSNGKLEAKNTHSALTSSAQSAYCYATITHNGVSYDTARKSASYSVYGFYLLGFDTSANGGWTKNDARLFKYDSDRSVWTVSKLLTEKTYTNNTEYGFKVLKKLNGTETYYDASSKFNMTRSSNDNKNTALDSTDTGNIGLVADAAGTYVFDLTISSAASAVPTNIKPHYPQKITYDKNGKTTTAFPSTTAYVTYNTAIGSAPATTPAATGYTFTGWKKDGDASTFDFANTKITAATTLKAQWSEDTVSVAVKAFTGDSESTTGGTVSPTSVTVGIDTSLSSVATAQAASGYIFNGWQVVGGHISLYTDAACTAAYVAGDRSHTTIYIKTDGTSPLGSENYVRADFLNGARTYVVGQMVKDDAGNYTVAKASASSNTGDGFDATTTIANSGNVVMYGTASMTTTGDIYGTDTQNPTVNFTGATASGGYYTYRYVKYDFVGWKKSDTALTEISGSNTTWDEDDASITPDVPATGEGYWYACYRKQYVFCAFRSYNYDAGVTGNIIFIASPPTKYQIGSAAATGYTEQGAKFAVPAGEDLKLTYSSLASSDCIDHVYYDDTNYTTDTPTAENFNNSNQHEITTGISTDQSTHEVTISMTQNYKNIHISLGTKYKIFFSDYKNAIIHSKNVDDYYAPGEAVSGDTEAKYLTVKASGNASQTNKIVSSNVKFYYCNSSGEFTDASGNVVDEPVEITGTDLAFEAGDSVNSGATDGTARKITGTMPNTNVYVDLGLNTSYEFHLGTRMVSDTANNYVTWAKVADTVATYQTHAWHDTDWDTATQKLVSWNNGAITAVDKGDSVTLSWTYWTKDASNNPVDYSNQYMFLGWYKGDASGPDYSKKGLISEKQTFSYTPRSNVYIYALGTRDLYINGTMSITGAESSVGNWPTNNFKMKFDPDYVNTDSTRGRYYWEITEEMLNATSDPGKLTALYNSSNGIWLQAGLYNKSSYGEGSTTRPWNRAAANSWFRIYDSATNSGVTNTSGLSYWAGIDDQVVNKTDSNGTAVLQWGKANTGDGAYDTEKQTLGLGFINYNPTSYPAYSAPIRIYAYPGHGINVEATPVYANLYVSNGFDVGATSKSTAVTVQPVKNGAVATGSDAFTITNVDTYTGSNEGTVTHYKPEKKNATVRITKRCTATEKVSAFFVYDLDNDKVYSLKDVQNSSNDWYIDLTVKLQQNLYIVPIIEETSANVTVNFDATQLNKTQWGDIVSCYAWYADSSATPALGAFPGQPMIVSDDLGSWTAKFPEKKTIGGTEYSLAGITFSNYVDGNQSWLGRTSTTGNKPVMCTVNYSTPHGANTDATHVYGGVGSISSVEDDGLIKQYNKIISGKSEEYSRQNFKAQTYDYREPIAIFKNRDTSEGTDTTITFAMKDGDSSLLSWRHAELLNNNIINLPSGWTKLNWEYLTNSTGNKYSDLNGQPLDGKPTATYYIAAKGGYIYNKGNVSAAFYSGKSYDTADHSYVNTDDYETGNTNSYAVDGTPTGASSANYGWVHDGCAVGVSYGDATNTSADPADIDFNYAVQWYVYDASGNYITTVLSAAFADMNNAKTQTYIAKELTSKGYAVDGKAVAMCYDKPRYYYWDSDDVTNGAMGWNNHKVNSGEGFAGYRFTGQWYTTVKTEPVTVDVKVGMMTESGEIMSENNVEPYGSATAAFSTANGTASYAHSSDGTKSVTVALADAEKRLVKLDADPTNFIGWYYYDTNTGDLEKASYDSNADFFPNFNKDVTYYALYRAAATYRYKYAGREGNQYYSVSGGDLTAAELEDNKIDWGVGERTTNGTTGKYDMKKLAPTASEIGVFKKTINFSSLDYTAAATYDATKDYTLDIGPFTNTVASYNLTYYYPTSKGGELVTHTQSFQYNQTVDMQGEVATAAAQNAPEGQIFIGWYEYNASTSTYGALLTQQANYGFVMTKEMTIAAKYAAAKDTDDETWRAFIDDNEVTRELNTATSGRYYNDTIVRFRKGTNAATHVPEDAEVGVLILNDGKTNGNITVTNDSKLTNYANNLNHGDTGKIGSQGKTVTKLCKTITDSDGSPLTYYNRYDFALRSDYATTKGSKYTVYAYVKIGDTYSWSTVASGTYD